MACYTILSAKPRTAEWYKQRKGFITPSRLYSCCHNFFDSTPEKVARILCGLEKAVISEEGKKHIERGKGDESPTRKYYEEHNNVKVVQLTEEQIAVCSRDSDFRGIPDGLIFQNGIVIGVVEIKSKEKVDDYFYKFVPENDSYQMLGYMALFGALWCDYVVKIGNRNEIHIRRVYFDEVKWMRIYSEVENFKKELLYPLRKSLLDKRNSSNERQNAISERVSASGQNGMTDQNGTTNERRVLKTRPRLLLTTNSSN